MQNVYSLGGKNKGGGPPDLGDTYEEWLRGTGTNAGEVEGILRRGGHPEGVCATVDALRAAHRASVRGSDRSPGGTPLTWTDVVFLWAPDSSVLIHDWTTYQVGDQFVLFREEAGSERFVWAGDLGSVVVDTRHPRRPDAVLVQRQWAQSGVNMAFSFPVVSALLNACANGWPASDSLREAIGASSVALLSAIERPDHRPDEVAVLKRGLAFGRYEGTIGKMSLGVLQEFIRLIESGWSPTEFLKRELGDAALGFTDAVRDLGQLTAVKTAMRLGREGYRARIDKAKGALWSECYHQLKYYDLREFMLTEVEARLSRGRP